MKRHIAILFIFAALLAGCSGDADDIGIVARVNGSPIYLSQLEFQHDQFQEDSVGAYVPSVAKLRREYGEILSDLIVQELVVQELARRDLSVTDEELRKAENTVRGDYPEGAFEQVLVEEYIDLKSWRRQLRYYLAQKKFFQLVLRPQIKIDYKEAEKYYRDHISDFYLAESLRILVVRGPSRELVVKAVEKYLKDHDQMNLATAFGEVETREVVVREGRLSAPWRNALTGLKPGQASDVLTDRFGFEALVLLERSEAKVLPPAQAYPLVEEALLEKKMENAFEKWLSGDLAKADIQVSEHLLESAAKPGDDEASAPAVIAEPEEPAAEEAVEPPPVEDDMNGQEPADEAIPMDQLGTDTGI
ncbi:Chaperone SurA [Pseudodesulfovibrio hydrargyri]|uniref:peptidylprolyl isomerase n=1 Tax=Pseudodesulfovibrio hydrargyri TaxID=2125990 RepID=A0A1J5MQG8_9BACT|nr:peptidylprolyl isomerase [Pseudodesulfovibrio hydrargyri]OIQ48862.1 Chaperone SurA [Pseudodesulfovibrio hydrargyri]